MLMSNEDNIAYLKQIVNLKNHIAVRMGFTEVRLLESWYRSNFSDDYINLLCENNFEKHWLSCAGIFPLNKTQVNEFLTQYRNIILQLSLEPVDKVSYCCTLKSDLFENHLFKNNTKITFGLNVWDNLDPFQRNFKNKKICVVTPFPKSFEHQLGKLSKLFKDERLVNLNVDNVLFVKSPPHKFISNETENPFETWNDAVEYMKSEIDKREYDILLTGCGAFSLPLNYHAYKKGKTTLNMGGDLQLMFGVKGKRWKQEYYQFNEDWIFPLEEEVPKGNFKVEDGAYW